MSRPLLHALILIGAGVAAYANSLRVPFVFDDHRLIVREPVIKPPLSAAGILATDRPVVTASLAMNYAVGGLDVVGYHVVNLLVHLVGGLVLYGFARFTFRLPALRPRFGDAADGLALAAAGIFVLHPMQTESVTYVIQRGELLAATALLGIVWLAAVAATTALSSPIVAAMVTVGLLGAGSKPTFVAAPLLFAVYDWCLLAEGRFAAMRRRWPIYLLLTGVTLACVPFLAFHPEETVAMRVRGVSAGQYLLYQLGVVPYYVRLALVPDHLCFDCGFTAPWVVERSLLGKAAPLAGVALLVGLAAAVRARRRQPLVTFTVIGSSVVLLPTSSIPITDVYVEHRMYLAIGLLAMLAVGAGHLGIVEATRRGWLSSPTAHRLATAAVAAAWLGLGALTVARNGVYADPLHLWQDSVAKAPENARAQFQLGNELLRRGDSPAAITAFRESVRLEPGVSMAWVNMASELLRAGNAADAAQAYRSALASEPNLAIAHRGLALALLRLDNGPDALAAAERAAAIAPDDVVTQSLLGDMYAAAGRREDALRAYRSAARLSPQNARIRAAITRLDPTGP